MTNDQLEEAIKIRERLEYFKRLATSPFWEDFVKSSNIGIVLGANEFESCYGADFIDGQFLIRLGGYTLSNEEVYKKLYPLLQTLAISLKEIVNEESNRLEKEFNNL